MQQTNARFSHPATTLWPPATQQGRRSARQNAERLPGVTVAGHDASADVRGEARTLGLCDAIVDDAAEAVADAETRVRSACA